MNIVIVFVFYNPKYMTIGLVKILIGITIVYSNISFPEKKKQPVPLPSYNRELWPLLFLISLVHTDHSMTFSECMRADSPFCMKPQQSSTTPYNTLQQKWPTLQIYLI